VYVGSYMTSLNAPGFSITLMNLVATGLPEDLLTLLDYQTDTVGWHAPSAVSHNDMQDDDVSLNSKRHDSSEPQTSVLPSTLFADLEPLEALRKALTAVIEAEPEVTRFDTVVGDGDCGDTLKRGAQGKLHRPHASCLHY
jgi:dihydroxyacetone kinase